jgi:hypothetical protein
MQERPDDPFSPHIPVDDPPGPTEADDLDAMRRVDLIEVARARGLAIRGGRAELIERIRAAS